MQLLHPLLILFHCILSLQHVSGIEETHKKVVSASVKEAIAKAKAGLKNSEGKIQTVDARSFEDLGLKPPPSDSNDTLKEDHHTYYNSTTVLDEEAAKAYWVDLDKMPQEHVITHTMLSNSHRQATTITLTFDFPFYGNPIRNITIATGGFLYTGDYLHSWIAATQYVAPLMANFDTRRSDDSKIKYADNGTAFTVQWEKVNIQGRFDDGAFTFQVTLLKNGDIIFAYKDIPYSISEISDNEHPVKIGISDAYIMERRIFFMRRKTIYEYHRIDLLMKGISNNTAIYFTALPTCLDYHTCQECLESDQDLECSWCDSVQRCSDGVDRQRQNWLHNECTLQAHGETCPSGDNGSISFGNTSSMNVPLYVSTATKERTSVTTGVSGMTSVTTGVSGTTSVLNDIPVKLNNSRINSVIKEVQGKSAAYSQDEIKSDSHSGPSEVGPAVIVAIVVVLAAMGGIIFWVYYAYKFPHSSSGQFLIKYRPSQWKVGKAESSSSTSPSLHM